jgi:hypothetical protein
VDFLLLMKGGTLRWILKFREREREREREKDRGVYIFVFGTLPLLGKNSTSYRQCCCMLQVYFGPPSDCNFSGSCSRWLQRQTRRLQQRLNCEEYLLTSGVWRSVVWCKFLNWILRHKLKHSGIIRGQNTKKSALLASDCLYYTYNRHHQALN